jgi:hypothetical protein
MTQPLFDSGGKYIAFRRSVPDKYVFADDGSWLGWLPYDNGDLHDHPDGRYLGTIVRDRLLVLTDRPRRGRPTAPGAPGLPGTPRAPGHRPSIALPPGARDLAAGAAPPLQPLYDSTGEWLGFRAGKLVFDTAFAWRGWLPFDRTTVVVDPTGHYLGTVVDARGRFLRLRPTPRFVRPVWPIGTLRPTAPARPLRPARVPAITMPARATDVSWAAHPPSP